MTWFFENYKTKNANSKVFADGLGPHWVHPTQAGTANASAVVLVVKSDFRSKIENRENRRNCAFEISAHIWRLGSKIIVSRALKHAETDSERFRTVWGLWRNLRTLCFWLRSLRSIEVRSTLLSPTLGVSKRQKHKVGKMFFSILPKMQMCCCMFVIWMIKFDVWKNSCNYYYYY